MHHLRSYQLAVEFYGHAKATKLPAYVKNQLQRAALSVVLNLSEGAGKRTTPDRNRFFQIAMGSIRECQAVVEVESTEFTLEQKDILDHLAASTFKLIKNSRNPLAASRIPRAAMYRK